LIIHDPFIKINKRGIAMKIAITGGKGGTGKSTVSTALAIELAKKYKVMLVDADVECPDDHILLSVQREKVKDVKTFFPVFNEEECLRCGECGKICQENAILLIKDNLPFIADGQCMGCGACILTCKNEAITEKQQIIGNVSRGLFEFDSGDWEDIMLISGEMKVGYESSSPVLNACIDFASNLEEEYDYLLIDTAAGTHCNVIKALMSADLALAVTEPTPLGKHDLNIILKLLEILKIRSKIIVNKSDIGDLNLIHELEQEHGIKIISKIPYTKKILNSYSKGVSITHTKISEIVESLESIT
jgi:MinD superfamily P-loop ATPase